MIYSMKGWTNWWVDGCLSINILQYFLYFLSGCPYGFFGETCANSCNSKCTGCSNVNGSCLSGCHPGWKGDYCQESKYVPVKNSAFSIISRINSSGVYLKWWSMKVSFMITWNIHFTNSIYRVANSI